MIAPLRHTGWAGGVENEPIEVTFTLSYVASGRGKGPEYRVSAGTTPSSTFSGLCDGARRDIVRLIFTSFFKLIQ